MDQHKHQGQNPNQPQGAPGTDRNRDQAEGGRTQQAPGGNQGNPSGQQTRPEQGTNENVRNRSGENSGGISNRDMDEQREQDRLPDRGTSRDSER
jgi:hypothetical protein